MKNKKTYIVALTCGLGNQMFQYAFSKAFENKIGKKVLLYNTAEELEKTKVQGTDKDSQGCIIRPFGLSIFPNVEIEFATKEQVEKCIDHKGPIRIHLPGFLRKMFKLQRYMEFSNKVEAYEYSDYKEELLKRKKSAYFDGYFQNEKYLKGIESKIRHDFELPQIPLDDEFNQNLLNKIKNENSVMVHIRKGDYIRLGWQLNDDYYKRAIKLIKEKVNNPKFFVFSSENIDDIKNIFNEDETFEYIGNTNNKNKEDWKDLKLMTECKHAIIANSTFSWWGSWLTDNKDKITVAPSPWLLEKDEIICSNWYKIDMKKGE